MAATPSAPPTSTDPRSRLLDAALDHVAGHGVGDLSLRQLAAALGTSHRMILYHFGSKEGLLVEVVRAMEARQRAVWTDLDGDDGMSPAELARELWRRLTDPALAPHERLFFEMYGQALQGRPGTTALLDGIVDSWVEPATESAVARGMPAADARAHARLGLAVIRGLLLDLLATGDRAAVDAALQAFLSRYENGLTDPA
jgi:AcrR family transcriptional regulator